jgi:hypothetical protein
MKSNHEFDSLIKLKSKFYGKLFFRYVDACDIYRMAKIDINQSTKTNTILHSKWKMGLG